jgi:ATP-dependent DNA helicase RecG
VQIALFKDRVEILNPGKLYAGLSVEDILSKPISERRNSLIADIFHKVNLIEKWGTGIGKIRKLEPKTMFEEIGNFFMVTFKRRVIETTPKTSLTELEFEILELIKKDNNLPKQVLLDYLGKGWEKVGKRLGITQLKIIIVLSSNKEYTIDELSQEIGISTTAIENGLRKLKDEGILKRHGGRKEGSWEVIWP